MNTRKCPSCGGEMELSISSKCLICPFCDTHIDVDIKDEGNTGLLDDRMFDFLWNLKTLKTYEKAVESIDSMRYCLNSLKTAESVVKYIRTTLISDEDVASAGINQHRIDKVMPQISGFMEPGEQIIVYGDDGIFSRGKEYFVITDKRSIFVNGKKTGTVAHSEVIALRLDPNIGSPRWKLNNQDSFAVTGVGNKYRLQGAVAALICLYAWDANKEKIKLM